LQTLRLNSYIWCSFCERVVNPFLVRANDHSQVQCPSCLRDMSVYLLEEDCQYTTLRHYHVIASGQDDDCAYSH
jgi:hypothetical protein